MLTEGGYMVSILLSRMLSHMRPPGKWSLYLPLVAGRYSQHTWRRTLYSQ